ncbi:hypothetical protein [Nostoc sp.]|uniref:hypothetical protein n=1 Tax=Nostoc sp. TaxID=1180 RepID=UPI002FF56841
MRELKSRGDTSTPFSTRGCANDYQEGKSLSTSAQCPTPIKQLMTLVIHQSGITSDFGHTSV